MRNFELLYEIDDLLSQQWGPAEDRKALRLILAVARLWVRNNPTCDMSRMEIGPPGASGEVKNESYP